MCSGSNLGWTVEKALEGWVVEKIVGSDSTIALSWTMAEMKPLAMFHKNRVIQIRRGTRLDQLYHVRMKVNSRRGDQVGQTQDPGCWTRVCLARVLSLDEDGH